MNTGILSIDGPLLPEEEVHDDDEADIETGVGEDGYCEAVLPPDGELAGDEDEGDCADEGVPEFPRG